MSTSNIFSNVFIYGNCTVQGTFTSLGGSAVSQWTTTGSSIYYNTGNIGIGTATPGQLLSLNNGNILLAGTWTAGTTYSLIGYNTDKRLEFNYSNGTVIYDNNAFLVRTGGSSGGIGNLGLYQNATGYVGIGTTNPGSLLTVSGGVGIGSGYNSFTAPTGGLIVQGNVGIGTSNPGLNALQVSGNVVTSGFTSNATNTVFNFDTLTVPFVNATQVGIGTTNPSYSLDVYGQVNIRSANPSYSSGTIQFNAGSVGNTSNGMVEVNYGSYTNRYGITQAVNGRTTIYTANPSTYAGSIRFSYPSGTDFTDMMVIQSTTGYVGIGTASPQAVLDVRSSALIGDYGGNGFLNSNAALHIRRSGVNPHLIIENIGVSTGAIAGVSGGMVYGTDGGGFHAFRTGCTFNGDYPSTGTERMRINTTGVGIGITNPTKPLVVTRPGAAGNFPAIMIANNGSGSGLRFQTYDLTADANAFMGLGTDMGGNAYEHSLVFSYGSTGQGRQSVGSYDGTTYSTRSYILTSSTNWVTISDIRSKDIVRPISNVLPLLSNLSTIVYTLKEDTVKTEHLGLIAQEVALVFPEACDIPTDPEQRMGVNYSELVPVLVEAVKELAAKNEHLEARLAALEGN